MTASKRSSIHPRDLKTLPIERSETIPSGWYTQPEFHEIDKQHIFSQTWQYVGSLSQLPRAGEYILGVAAENPILIIRGRDDVVRAFFNVCRHRGGPLAIEPSGNCSILQCKYHGWTYLLDGSLRGTPKFNRTELFDKKDYGLFPVNLEIWQNLLFVKLSNNGKSFSLMMKRITDRLKPNALSEKKFHRRINYELRCNWKVYVDNYLEGYHLPFVHPELCNLLDYQQYVTETFDNYSLQYSPFAGSENVYTNGEGEAYYYFLFPNFMMNILPGRLQTNLVLPLTHNTCRVIFDYYYDDVSSPDAQKRIEDDISYSEKVQCEDMEICHHVQKGLESIAYDKGRFSPEMEAGVYHFQSLLKKYYKNISSRKGRRRGT